MAISDQRIDGIKIKKLKNIIDLDLSFKDFPVTAILGPNGSGKSTILHAIACAFQPENPKDGENYKFSNFFIPHPDALWKGSEIHIEHTFRDGKTTNSGQPPRIYTKKTDRWTPRYTNRPKRNIFYIGIDKCVPLIESEKKQTKISYSTKQLTDDIVNKILEKASFVMNKKYSKYNEHDTGNGKKIMGVEVNGIPYSALSMSAGEQKVFLILETILRAKKYSLILIDELDLLLHDMALANLIEVICERSDEKKIQVIFTTHRESVLNFSRKINIRHILHTSTKTLCFCETKPEAISRLTGKKTKVLEIFVEDDLAKAIIMKVANSLKLARFISIVEFGAALNCFTTVAGLLLGGGSCENSLFVLDGDVYSTQEEKEKRIKEVVTGDDPAQKAKQQIALEKITQFNLPENTSPEQYLHDLIIKSDLSEDESSCEIIEVAKEIICVNNRHDYIDSIVEKIGMERGMTTGKIIDIISKSPDWEIYIKSIKDWLLSKREICLEETF